MRKLDDLLGGENDLYGQTKGLYDILGEEDEGNNEFKEFGEIIGILPSVEILSSYLTQDPIKNIEEIKYYKTYDKIEEDIKPIEYFNFEKEINNKENIKYTIPTILGNNFYNIQPSPLGLNLTIGDSVVITADNIGEFALPIVEYIHQTKPDYVIASDRGARLLGLAVFRLYNSLYGRFPTSDGTIRFRRFSKSNSQEETEEHMKPLVDEMLQHKERPTVLVLDDWVVSGGTKRMAQQVFDILSKGRIKTKFGVLIGGGADVSGHSDHNSGFASVTDWRDDSNIIGVIYGNYNWGHTGLRATPVKSEQARDYRKRMYEGIEKFVIDKLVKIVKEEEVVMATPQ